MKKVFLLLVVIALGLFALDSKAQLANGSIAPNFTFNDINGVSQDLYTILNSGKVVIIDLSATWCGPCWSYHNSGNLENFYNQYGPAGTNVAMVFLMEGELANTPAQLTGSNVGGSTTGNWVTGTPYPIIDVPNNTPGLDFMHSYMNANYPSAYSFPTIYMICPDKTVTKVGQATTVSLYNTMMAKCPPPTAVNDAGISSVVSPDGIVCATSITPVVSIRNFGFAALTSCTINYQVDSDPVQTYAWTGNLTTGQIANVTLPSVATTGGIHTFTSYTSNPNSISDGNAANDQTINNYNAALTGMSLPVAQGMEGTFPPSGWAIDNPDGDITWEASTPGGFSTSSKSAKMSFYTYTAVGAMDYFVIPPIDLSASTSANLAFSVAYALYSASYADVLDVEVSVDCGTNWTNVYSKSGAALATAPTTGSSFTPTAAQWRAENVNLSAYIGQPSVMVRFKSTNDYGNNLYLDDINITPSTSVNDIDISSYVKVFPNPSAGYVFVNLNAVNLGDVNVKIFNIMGEVIAESTTATVGNIKFDLSNQPDGMYFIEIKSDNAVATKKIMLNK